MSQPVFVITLTGPLLKYRLDILRRVCPSVREYIIIFTDKFSYDLYHAHHDFFNFVIMDEYRNKSQFSIDHEILTEHTTEEEFLDDFSSVYNRDNGIYYPWEIHRFALDYLAENNILNFVLTQSDYIIRDDISLIREFFDSIPQGLIYAPTMGVDPHRREHIWEPLQESFPEINLRYDGEIAMTDGYFRGFHFHSKDDIYLFLRIWNKAIEYPYLEKAHHSTSMAFTDHIYTQLAHIFKQERNYNIVDMYIPTLIRGVYIGRHATRPEDTIYAGPREAWKVNNFDYTNTGSISEFIINNKDKLKQFYSNTFDVEITDSHVFTKLK